MGTLWATLGALWVPWGITLGTLGPPWANFRSLGGLWGTLGVPFGFGAAFGRLLATFLDTLGTFIVFSLDIPGFPQLFMWYSFEFPCYSVLLLFLRYYVFIPLVFPRYS